MKLSVQNYKKFQPVAFGAALLRVMLNATEGAHTTDYIELLTGIDEAKLLKQLENRTYLKKWEKIAKEFAKKRKEYLLYD